MTWITSLLLIGSGLISIAAIMMMLAARRGQQASGAQVARLNASLESSEARFHDLIETAPDAMVIANRSENIVLVNSEAERLFGYPRSEMIGRPITMLMPESFRVPHHGRIAAFLENPRIQRMGYGLDLYGRRKDGVQFPIETNLSQLPSSGERLVSSAIRDMTPRRDADERQALLIRELNHRVKNILASVEAIVTLTLKSADTPEAFGKALTARLMALSQSHDVLTRNDWSGASVGEIVAEQLRPYRGTAPGGDDPKERFRLNGPDVLLGPNRAVTLGMVVGELATNSAKYGALSSNGAVAVDWTRSEQDGGAQLSLTWRERGGPPVKTPTRKGFGMRLVERSVRAGLGGVASVDFEPTGVSCRIQFPLLAVEA